MMAGLCHLSIPQLMGRALGVAVRLARVYGANPEELSPGELLAVVLRCKPGPMVDLCGAFSPGQGRHWARLVACWKEKARSDSERALARFWDCRREG